MLTCRLVVGISPVHWLRGRHTLIHPSFSAAGQWYKQTSPHSWTAENVLEWISDHVESTKFDASTLSLNSCTMDGSALCQMSQEQMIGIFGPQLGPHLLHNLQEHKTKYGKMVVVMMICMVFRAGADLRLRCLFI